MKSNLINTEKCLTLSDKSKKNISKRRNALLFNMNGTNIVSYLANFETPEKIKKDCTKKSRSQSNKSHLENPQKMIETLLKRKETEEKKRKINEIIPQSEMKGQTNLSLDNTQTVINELEIFRLRKYYNNLASKKYGKNLDFQKGNIIKNWTEFEEESNKNDRKLSPTKTYTFILNESGKGKETINLSLYPDRTNEIFNICYYLYNTYSEKFAEKRLYDINIYKENINSMFKYGDILPSSKEPYHILIN